jgi:hypothetical protein
MTATTHEPIPAHELLSPAEKDALYELIDAHHTNAVCALLCYEADLREGTHNPAVVTAALTAIIASAALALRKPIFA